MSFPHIEASAHKIAAVGERINIIINFTVVLNFGEVVTGIVELIERDPQAPDVSLVGIAQRFFSQCFGPAIETAWGRAERKVRFVPFIETAEPLGVIGKETL